MQYNGGILKGIVSMRPHGTPQSLEDRRRRVITFLKQMLCLHEIADGWVVTRTAYFVDATFQKGSEDALKA